MLCLQVVWLNQTFVALATVFSLPVHLPCLSIVILYSAPPTRGAFFYSFFTLFLMLFRYLLKQFNLINTNIYR